MGKKKDKRRVPPARKNVSKKVPNGTFVITNDKYFYGADGKSQKTRMASVVDSNRNDELALVKYTSSQKHGHPFPNTKGFKRHGDRVITLDNEGKAIKVDNQKFIVPKGKKRDLTSSEANEIKRWNVKESRYQSKNRQNLRRLKKRKK